MGCFCTRGIEKDPEIRMGVCTRDIEKDIGTLEGISDLLSLPNELLIEIVSFLETRDKVKLRYVSRRLQNISENTPSLWREFVWPNYNGKREGQCFYNVMKACGVHIRQLSFPKYVSVNIPEMAEMLKYCTNLTHLSGLNFLSNPHVQNKQLKETIEEMKYLQVLNISHHDLSPPRLNLKVSLKELNIFTRHCSEADIEAWIAESFTAQTLNIVSEGYVPSSSLTDFLLSTWCSWNSKIPAGHVICVKWYKRYEVPLHLFQHAPVFQLQYGETATLPFIEASSVGVNDGYLLLTDHDDGSKVVHKGVVRMKLPDVIYDAIQYHSQSNQLKLDDNVLNNLTELDLRKCDIDLKLIIIACPQLQRLNLQGNQSLRPLEDLQMIATYCSNLQGLNLIGTLTTTDIKFCLEVWEILSSMKLTYLSIDISLVGIMIRLDDLQKKQLVTLFKQCVTLQALELTSNHFYDAKVDYGLLFHFPSLQSCGLGSTERSTCVEDILATCKMLKCFRCDSSTRLSLSLQPHNNLQKLCISSKYTDLDDNFMDTVSAHGGLTYVVFLVHSVNNQGITTLIQNSPNLLTFVLYAKSGNDDTSLFALYDLLKKKFAHRQLFTSGSLELVELALVSESFGSSWCDLDKWYENHFFKYRNKYMVLWQ